MTRQQRIAIIGGGMGGLTAGILFQRTGVQAAIYEQAPQFARIGAGVNIGADGVNSKVRELLLGPEPAKYTGVVAYRSIFPVSRLTRPLETDGCKFWSDERHWANEDRHFIIYYTTKDKKEVYFVTGSPDPN